MKNSYSFVALILLPALFLKAQGSFDTIITLENEKVLIPAIDPEEWEHPFKERIGQIALPFDVKDSEGRHHSSEQYLGKVVILYFWNVWDWDACEKQTAALNRIAEKYWKDVAVISFVRENIQLAEFAFLQEHSVKFPIVPNARPFADNYHGHRYGSPIVFFIDREGIWRKIGRRAEDFEKWVEEILSQ